MSLDAKRFWFGEATWDQEIETFAESALSPWRWVAEAWDQLRAAEILLPHAQHVYAAARMAMANPSEAHGLRMPRSVTNIYFLHCSVGAENAFKAVIAGNLEGAEETIRRTGKLPRALLTHDLIQLADRSGYELDLDAEHTLRFLTRYGTWSGRYPLPVNTRDHGLTVRHSDGSNYLVGTFDPEDLPDYLRFAADIAEWAQEITPARPNKVLQEPGASP